MSRQRKACNQTNPGYCLRFRKQIDPQVSRFRLDNSSMTMIQWFLRMFPRGNLCIFVDLQTSRFRGHRAGIPLKREISCTSPEHMVCILLDLRSSSFRHHISSNTMIPLCLCMTQLGKPCICVYPLGSKFRWDMMDGVPKNSKSSCFASVVKEHKPEIKRLCITTSNYDSCQS